MSRSERFKSYLFSSQVLFPLTAALSLVERVNGLGALDDSPNSDSRNRLRMLSLSSRERAGGRGNSASHCTVTAEKWVRIKSILFCFAFTAAVSVQSAEHKKYLIEFGWDEPDSHYLREHIAEMEKLPFDGCVFHINYQKPSGGEGSFTWEGWSSNTITKAQVASAIDDLKATKLHQFTHNFLRFNVTPGDLDWFDDHSAILNNARLAAEVAREGKCQGVLFDIEQYNSTLFQYHSRRDATNKSWEVYARQVRQRGNEVMRAFRQSWPDATIFLTFGYSLPWSNSRAGHKSLLDCNYGLLAPFLDGMMEVAAKGQIIDGAETAYSFNNSGRFAPHYKSLRDDLLPIVADPKIYQDKISIGFGIWLDHDWRKSGWETNDVSKNYFTPSLFEASVREALKVADDYVWIYTEQPRWWGKDAKPEKLPDAYVEALRKAKAEP